MKLRSFAWLLVLGLVVPLQAEIKPASMFSDHMVLQRNLPIPIWGTAAPGETVTVTLGADKQALKAGPDGKWMVRLAPQPATINLTLTIEGSATATPVVFKDVLIGEVWVCSGQSNMEFPVARALNGLKEASEANYPQLRLFQVDHVTPSAPQTSVAGQWRVCNPATIKTFSAVGYFFGRELQSYLNVPVGLIHTSWGGTPAEAWTRLGVLQADPDYAEIVKRRAQVFSPEYAAKQEEFKKISENWTKQIDQLLTAPGKPGVDWFKSDAVLKDWQPIEASGTWEVKANLKMDGVVWYRKVVEVPAEMASQETTLSLGAVDDLDFTWVNGTLVGHTGKDTPSFWMVSRFYKVPAGTLKPGPNVIMVRVIDHGGGGGLVGLPGEMTLSTASGASISLAGTWQYWIEKNLGLRPEMLGKLQNTASVLYDGMIAPIIPYGIRGAIWYQGESNASRAWQYRKLFPDMIRNWRQDWGQGDFPFYFVQLANFRKRLAEPAESDWPELREAQLKTLSLPNTGMAVTIDIGDGDDIHPINKQDVGKRLALWALAQDYGVKVPDGFLGTLPVLKSHFQKPIVHSGPLYKSMKVEGATVRLAFTHVGGGLKIKGNGPLKGFAVAGADKKFVWAEARLSDNTVVVRNVNVPNPVAVRYNWADNPEGNLYNAEGLPASPFRTDDWPGITDSKR